MVREEELKEKVEKFKSLIKQGYNVTKAQKESKLHPRDYTRLRKEIWSDPEMAPFKPKPRGFRKKENVRESEQRDEKDEEPKNDEPKNEEQGTISPVDASMRRLAKLGMTREKTQFERDFEELEEKRKIMLQAAQNVLMKYGAPEMLSQSAPTSEEKDPLAEFEAAFKDFEEKRNRIKQMLEGMGFKVEDIYMKRDEVEKLIEEAKRKAADETLEDKRIDAVKDLIRDAFTQVVEMFRPAIQKYFGLPASEGGASESSKLEKQPAEASG